MISSAFQFSRLFGRGQRRITLIAESSRGLSKTLQTVRKRDPIGGMDIAHSFVGA
jgi:hypothetical protein